MSSSAISITAAETVCSLGGSLSECLASWRAGKTGLAEHDGMLQGRIADRSVLKGRRYGAVSNLAVRVARAAVERSGWTAEETKTAWLFAASSRGNADELLGHNDWRRPSARFRASNTIHSEIAAAVSIELGIRGPWQMLSSGCSAGLDALGMAWTALRAGLCQRALVVAADLPLVPELIEAFRATRLLATDSLNDPLSPTTTGLHLGEAGVALTLELSETGLAEVTRYAANSDAYDSLAIPEDGASLAELLSTFPRPVIICPHATGTPNHSKSEMHALRTAFVNPLPSILLLKPFTGHTLGANGLLDTALIASALPNLPGNLPGLTGVSPDVVDLHVGDEILKITSGMGGHNAAIGLKVVAPPVPIEIPIPVPP
ncbi:beta-ketoacyl synthase N-terminal-like domain-containing protein [Brevifollis gellanilyticus]|uniref:Beta-ACP synthase n=1 Tax=Brevifollis gellanilyticus TaxID=748831 RepID=A0A512MFS5_9BACT|nr:beta-ketoacyl synthase N-terminal-like domain-containing protein [Brevifollis gellanilyticus]GEP45594.1 beta-ACP synthase [Brevifollis gellanilyticus]